MTEALQGDHSVSGQQWYEGEDLTGVELEKFEVMCQELYQQKGVVDEIRAQDKLETEKLEKMKKKILSYMEKYGKDKYPVSGCGTISVVNKFTAKMPQDLGLKQDFFTYLRDKGIFEQMVTVHALTLNSFVQTELADAVAQGNPDFKIPGINEFGMYKTLSVRSK